MSSPLADTAPSLTDAVILGVVQGITEFLPISSDGHLALGQKLLKSSGGLDLTVLLHTGTLLATLLIFRQQIIELLQELVRSLRDPARWRTEPNAQQILAVIVATIPTGIIGLALKKSVEQWTNNLWVIGICFLGTAVALLATRQAKAKEPWTWSMRTALIIGVAQGAAVLPGLSRSALTIATALLLGAPPVQAFRFSFLLSIPAVAGAIVLELRHENAIKNAGGMHGVVGAIVSFFVGVVALTVLAKIIARGKLWQFAVYVILLALVTLALAWRG